VNNQLATQFFVTDFTNIYYSHKCCFIHFSIFFSSIKKETPCWQCLVRT